MNRKSIVLKTILSGTILLGVIFGALMYLKSQEVPGEDSGEAIIGSQIPDFEFESIPGSSDVRSRFKVSDFKGKLLLINFWATWCTSCLIEMPSLISLQERLKSEGLELITVSVDEGPLSEVPALLSEKKWKLRAAFESSQKASSYFRVEGLPTTIVVSKEGKILASILGEQDWTDSAIQKRIKEWMSK